MYFIGKLVWAKGFDLMLELQEIFRKRHGGEYFPIDVYGGGPDEKAIARAFHGRHHTSPTRRPTPPPPSTKKDPVDSKDLNAAAVFSNPRSIKDQSSHAIEQIKQRRLSSRSYSGVEADNVVVQYLSLGFEVTRMNGSATYVNESRNGLAEGKRGGRNSSKNPLDILGDLSDKSIDTGVKTSQAVYNIADSSIKNIILTMSFSQLKHLIKNIRNGRKREQQQNIVMEAKPQRRKGRRRTNTNQTLCSTRPPPATSGGATQSPPGSPASSTTPS